MEVVVREHNRVVVPIQVARDLGIEVGDELVLDVYEGSIILTPKHVVAERLRQGFGEIPHSLADRLIVHRQQP